MKRYFDTEDIFRRGEFFDRSGIDRFVVNFNPVIVFQKRYVYISEMEFPPGVFVQVTQ